MDSALLVAGRRFIGRHRRRLTGRVRTTGMGRRRRFTLAAFGAFAATLCGFVTMGMTRGFVGYSNARLLAAPFVALGVLCAIYALTVSVLVVAGVVELDA